MDQFAFEINPADLQFTGYVPEERSSNSLVILILLAFLIMVLLVVWFGVKEQTKYEALYKSDNLKKGC